MTEDLFWQAAGPLIDDGEPSAVLLAGMMVPAADLDAGGHVITRAKEGISLPSDDGPGRG